MGLLDRLLEFALKKAYPDRDWTFEKIGRRRFIIAHDTIGNLTFSLQGIYPYEEVVKLNNMTGYSARYGFCPGKGPVAVIGIPNPNIEFSFFQETWAYGNFCPEEEFEFRKYTDDEAKGIGNYTVYGYGYSEKLADAVKFDKLNNSYDSRHQIKSAKKYKVFNMEYMFDGKYDYMTAKKLVEHTDFRMVGEGITFVKVGKSLYVGIIGFWGYQKEFAAGFRDVWEYGMPEPEVQEITFLSDEEAKKISDFMLYGYDYILPNKFEREYPIIRVDRTFDRRFDFYDTPDGKDFRLTERVELLRSK